MKSAECAKINLHVLHEQREWDSEGAEAAVSGELGVCPKQVKC